MPADRRAWRLALPVLAVFLVASPASAQVLGTCAMTFSVNPAAFEHAPGQPLRYNATVAATGSLGGNAEVRIDSVSPGWNATLERGQFAVQAGQQQTTGVLVTAPAGDGARQASVALVATLTCAGVLGAAGTATDSQALSPTLAAAPVAPPGPDGPGAGSGGLLLLLLGLVVVGAGVGAAVLALRPKGLVLKAAEAKRDLPPGGGASFPVAVTNRGKERIVADLQVGDLPAGWKVLAPPREVQLEPGASATLQLLVRSPPTAKPGDLAEVEVRALERGTGRVPRILLQAFVVPEGHAEARGPPPERPDVVVRDEGR